MTEKEIIKANEGAQAHGDAVYDEAWDFRLSTAVTRAYILGYATACEDHHGKWKKLLSFLNTIKFDDHELIEGYIQDLIK